MGSIDEVMDASFDYLFWLNKFGRLWENAFEVNLFIILFVDRVTMNIEKKIYIFLELQILMGFSLRLIEEIFIILANYVIFKHIILNIS